MIKSRTLSVLLLIRLKKGTRFFSQSQITAVSKQDNSEVTITTAGVISNFWPSLQRPKLKNFVLVLPILLQ